MNRKKKYKRLSLEQRVKLVIEMNKREKSSAIQAASKLRVSRQTIYNEIKNYSVDGDIPNGRTGIECVDSRNCPRNQGQRSCFNTQCESYIEAVCPRLSSFPFVCNKCERNSSMCKYRKRYYNPIESDQEARELRKTARQMDFCEDETCAIIDEFISPMIMDNRVSLHHAYETHKEKLNVCERSVRRRIEKGGTQAKPHHLPSWLAYQRVKAIKPTRTHAKNYEILDNRMYCDYLEFIADNPEKRVVQLDSVIGKSNDKYALMTIHHVETHFMFGFMYRKGSAYSFLNRIKALRETLGDDDFYLIFDCLLTDNGSETAKLHEIEATEDGECRANVFYTNPNSSYQKGAIEKNHEYVRRILPRGSSLNNVTDRFLRNMFSHINSIFRESIQNKTPYAAFEKLYGVDILRKLGIIKIEPEKVNLYSAKFYS